MPVVRTFAHKAPPIFGLARASCVSGANGMTDFLLCFSVSFGRWCQFWATPFVMIASCWLAGEGGRFLDRAVAGRKRGREIVWRDLAIGGLLWGLSILLLLGLLIPYLW